MKIILASKSKRRHELLKNLEFDFTIAASNFDERVIKKRMEYHKIKHSSLPKFVDLALDVIKCYIFPFKSYGLKPISDYLEYDSKHPDVDGMWVAREYLSTYQETKNEKLMKKFLEYNEDDLRSLKWMMDKLSSITPLANTQNINPAGMFNKWTTGGLTMLGYKIIGAKVNQMGFGSIVPATREIGGIGKSFIAGGAVGGLFDPPADTKPQHRGTAQYSIAQGTTQSMSSGDSTVSGL